MESIAHQAIQYCVFGTVLRESINLTDGEKNMLMEIVLELFNDNKLKIWHLRRFLSSQEIVYAIAIILFSTPFTSIYAIIAT